MSGSDILHVGVSTKLELIPELLRKYYNKFKEDLSKTPFYWIDQIAEIKDVFIKDGLNELLVSEINNQDPNKLWLAPPEIVDWQKTNGFKYRKSPNAALYADIHIKSFKQSLRKQEQINIHQLKDNHIFCWNNEFNNSVEQWPVYECIYFETNHKESTYLLNGGKWYRILPSFVQEVDKSIEKILSANCSIIFPPCKSTQSESDYNHSFCVRNPNEHALMDKKLIMHGGGRSLIEFCDIYSKTMQIIHIKRYAGSSVLSHLFSQGTVSGELFCSDSTFRYEVNEILPTSHKLKDWNSRPQGHEVVFGIMSRYGGDKLDLPFFSKLTLKQTYAKLIAFGYRVSVKKIQIIN